MEPLEGFHMLIHRHLTQKQYKKLLEVLEGSILKSQMTMLKVTNQRQNQSVVTVHMFDLSPLMVRQTLQRVVSSIGSNTVWDQRLT
jgi:hypothetical protein